MKLLALRRCIQSPVSTWLPCRVLLLFALGAGVAEVAAQTNIPAFPGAEGFGAYASGGRHGDVYHVNSLSPSATTPGTFAYGLSTAPATGRTIVFEVSGYIPVSGNLHLQQPNITIAGQTAPGDGVGLKGGTFWIEKTNVVIRHFRFRNGVSADCIDLTSAATNVMLDHCDMLFSTDENFSSFGNPPENMTFQWSFNAWGLVPHSAGGLWYVKNATSHHSLWAHNHTRDPKALPSGLLDWINNVTFDYGIGFIMADSTATADYKANVEGSYFICPPGNTRPYALSRAGVDSNGVPNFSLFLTNCLWDTDGDYLLDGYNPGYGMVSVHPTNFFKMSNAIPRNGGIPVTQDPPLVAYKKIVSQGGPLRLDANHPGGLRDEVATVLIDSLVKQQTQRFTSVANTGAGNGGYGTLTSSRPPPDTDLDGMPDYWEITLGSNPNVDDHTNQVPAGAFITNSPAGYTLLEEYLHFRATPHAFLEKSTSAVPVTQSVDLVTYTRGFTNKPPVTYNIGNVSTGAVTLIGGNVAHFVPPTNYFGRARFDFTVTDGDGSTWTQPFVMLVSAVPLPQDLLWRGDGGSNFWDTNALSFVEVGETNAVRFRNGDRVTFDDSGPNTPFTRLAGELQPLEVLVDNSAKNYTFGGAGQLSAGARLIKTGAGTLTLSNANTHLGGTLMGGGRIRLGNKAANGAAFGTGGLTMKGGGILELYGAEAGDIDGSGVGTFGNAISILADEVGTVLAPSRYTLASALTGGGTLNLRVNYVRGDVSGNWAGFLGLINVTSRSGVSDFRVAATAGYPNARVHLATNVLMYSRASGGAVIPIGEFTAAPGAVVSAGFGSSDGVQNAVTWRVGGLNTDVTNAASFQGTTKLIKQGTGTWTLSGNSTHAGSTTVSNGILAVTGTLGASPVTVFSNAVLTGNGILGGGASVQAGGVLSPAGTLTVSNQLAFANGVLAFDLSSSPAGSNDLILLPGGTLAFTNAVTIQLNLTDGFLGAGTYPLISGGLATISSNLTLTHNLPGGARQSFNLDTNVPGELALIVSGSPGYLQWRGTNGNAWDTTTTNWLNDGLADTFWPFDAVTFNDASTNGTVNLTGSIQPRSVLITNATRAYTFAGSGTLDGSASLVKSGVGTLTFSPTRLQLSCVTASNSAIVTATSTAGIMGGLFVTGTGVPANATVATLVDATTFTLSANATVTATNTLTFFTKNSFGGGTLVNGGTLALGNVSANNWALGPNVVTLNGGTLQLYGYGLSSTPDYGDFANDMVVNTSGTLKVPPRATIASRLTGAGTLNVVDDYVRADFTGDWSAFTGQLNVGPRSGGCEFRLANTMGLPLAALFLSNGITAYPTFSGGTLTVGELAGSNGSALGPGNGSGTNPTWLVGGKNTSATFAGQIEDAGVTSVIKTGSGIWTLTGSNTFSGGLVVSNGTVLVNGSLANSAVDVLRNATLGGSGVIGGAVTLQTDATLSPGASIGRLTISNALTFAADSTTFIELNPALGTNDAVVCSGAVRFDGALVVTNLGGSLSAGDEFPIFQAGSFSGSFFEINGSPGPLMEWSFNPSNGVLSVVGLVAPPPYQYSASITFPGYYRAETLTNIPLLVVLGTNIPGFSYTQFYAPNAGDLRFTTTDGSTELSHELDTWNPAGESRVWVQVPMLVSNAAILASWGNPVATNPPASSTNGSTWTEGFVGVWHLSDAGATDSTAGEHDVSSNTAVTTNGLIGGAAYFNGTAGLMQVPWSTEFNLASSFEVQGWLKVAATDKPAANNFLTLTAKEVPASFTDRNWWIALRSDGRLWWKSSPSLDLTNTTDLANGVWHHFAAVHDGAAARLYVDGVQAAVDATPGIASTQNAPVLFGNEDGTARYHKGPLDELRISNVPRSPNWVWAVFQNISSNGTFNAVSPVAGTTLLLPSLTAVLGGGSLQLTWPADSIGWRLQVQTNFASHGLGSNWFDVFGADQTNLISVPVNHASGAVFYRLAAP